MTQKTKHYEKHTRHAKLRRYTYFFGLALVLNYLPDFSPYYVSALSRGQVRVFGPLTNLAEPCLEPPQNNWICRVQYRIPNHYFAGSEAIGFGILLFSNEVTCSNNPNKTILLTPRERDGRISGNLRNYQILNLDRINCEADLIIKNWSPKSFNRYGHSQGPVAVGSIHWIERTKRLVETSVAAVAVLALFTFLAFFLVLKTLQRVTNISLYSPPFDDFRVHWLIFLLLISGYLFELILPIEFPHFFVSKLTNIFGLIAIGGPILMFVASSKERNLVTRAASFLVRHPKFGLLPLYAISTLLLSWNNFRVIYPIALIVLSALCLCYTWIDRSYIMLFYGSALTSDALKILMVPYLPASRLTATYLLFIFAQNMRQKIMMLEENARFEAGSNMALQIAHDIRSPLSALSTVVPMLSGDSEKVNIAMSALDRIRSVANRFQAKAKWIPDELTSSESANIYTLVHEVIREKQFDYSSNSRIEILETATSR